MLEAMMHDIRTTYALAWSANAAAIATRFHLYLYATRCILATGSR
jgi:hypothetical protein